MTDAFAELVMPVFQRVIKLQEQLSIDVSPALEDVKRRIKSWIEASGQRALVNPALAADFELAKFALVAWIDEALTPSPWGVKVDWGSEEHVLEWDYYSSHIRAVEFYRRAILAERQQSLEPLETYLICVTLGFRGMAVKPLGFREWMEQNYGAPVDFHEWIRRIYERITEASPLSARPFPDDGELVPGDLGPLRGPRTLVTVSALFAATALATLFAYIGAVHLAYTGG